jgi:acetyl-CoA C-acetyltransferase
MEVPYVLLRNPRVVIIGAGGGRDIFLARSHGASSVVAAEIARGVATKAALDSAEMTLDQIGCVVLGTAPDAFDGLHMKGEYLSDGCGGWKKPYLRCYVGGGTGVYAIAQGWFQIASGLFDTAIVICEEKMSTCQPHPQGAFLTIFDNITEQPLKPNLLWIFALEQNRYMATEKWKRLRACR